jgi:hypothetical protein
MMAKIGWVVYNLLLEQLLQLNDLINLVIQKHSDIRDGKQVASIAIDKKTGQTSPEPIGFVSLIDFDDGPSSVTNQTPTGGFSHDLGLLNFGPTINQMSNINSQNISSVYSKSGHAQATSSPFAQKSPISMTSKLQPQSILKKQSETSLFSDVGFDNISTTVPMKDLKQVQINTPPKNSENIMGLDLMSGDIPMIGYQNNAPKNPTTYAGVSIFEKNGLLITLQMIEGPNMITNLKAFFTNSTPTQFTAFNFQVAVPKVLIRNC